MSNEQYEESIRQTITFRWWRADEEPIKEAHKPALKERAEERILEMRSEGYNSGELCDNNTHV